MYEAFFASIAHVNSDARTLAVYRGDIYRALGITYSEVPAVERCLLGARLFLFLFVASFWCFTNRVTTDHAT